jgi:hypothetical protein
VVVMDRTGHYLPDMQQDELSVFEDGVQQKIAFFHKVSAPFHVVLMLDTSASTEEKLRQIQTAAFAFVEQLQPADRVMIISFDDQVRELNRFTNDRALLKSAIAKTRSGQGTKLYDAFGVALDAIRKVAGRKAIVLFTDGVDMYSDRATYEGTLRSLDEEGAIVYPIRYDTRVESERIARQQAQESSPQLPTIGVIRTPPRGTTSPTFPSDDPDSVPTRGSGSGGGVLGLPSPTDILRGRRTGTGTDPRDPNQRNDPRMPNPTGPGTSDPAPSLPTDPNGRPADGTRRLPNDPSRVPTGPGGLPRDHRTAGPDDSISRQLDMMYRTADGYLAALADKSGGRLLRADSIMSLPDAFGQIAAELRTQYAIGYYPSNTIHNGTYRAVKVSTSRKNAAIRAKPGYQAPSGD